jgi:hypothetical protein
MDLFASSMRVHFEKIEEIGTPCKWKESTLNSAHRVSTPSTEKQGLTGPSCQAFRLRCHEANDCLIIFSVMDRPGVDPSAFFQRQQSHGVTVG